MRIRHNSNSYTNILYLWFNLYWIFKIFSTRIFRRSHKQKMFNLIIIKNNYNCHSLDKFPRTSLRFIQWINKNIKLYIIHIYIMRTGMYIYHSCYSFDCAHDVQSTYIIRIYHIYIISVKIYWDKMKVRIFYFIPYEII